MPRAKAAQKTGTDTPFILPEPAREFSWHHVTQEGELAVDVAQTPSSLVIIAAIAGVELEDLSITIDHDVVTIRGARKREKQFPAEDYFYHECYWGPFSRSVILPVDVQKEKAKATLKNGILMITIPKARTTSAIPIEVIDEA